MPEALSPEGVIDFFARAQEVRSAQRTLAVATSERDRTQQLIRNWEERARAVVGCDTSVDGESLAERVEQLGVAQRTRREKRHAPARSSRRWPAQQQRGTRASTR